MNSNAAPLPLIVLLGLLIALTPLGTDTWLPALPSLGDSLAAPVAATQLTVTLFFAGIALGQLGWGPVSDRFGRKPAILGGLALACGATAAGMMSVSAEQVAAARFAQGLGLSSGPVVARSIVRDLYSHEDAARMLSSMTLVFSIVPIAAPLAGALLIATGGWHAVMAFFTAVTAALFLATFLSLRETAPAQRSSIHPARLIRAFVDIGSDARFLAPFAIMICGQIGIFAFVAGTPLVLVKGMDVAPATYGVLFAVGMLGQIFGAWLNRRLVIRLGMGRMLRTGAAITLAGGVAGAALAWGGVVHWLAVIIPFMVYMCGTSLITPNATAAALTPFPQAAGAASSVLGASVFTLGACISTLLAILFDGTARPLMTLVAIGGITAFAFELRVLRGKA